MIDIKIIRENPEILDHALLNRGAKPIAQELLAIDNNLRILQQKLQDLNTQRNEVARNIGHCKQHKTDETEHLKQAAEIKAALPVLEEEITAANHLLQHMLDELPNIPSSEVPIAADESGNQEISRFGTPKHFEFPPKEHFDLGEAMGTMDFTTAANMSGSRFVLLYKDLARMERALANFMLDMHTQEFGYTEVSPPLLVRDSAMYGTGQLPNLDADSFKVDGKFRLIPTAEVSLTNIVADKILAEEELPLRFTAHTPCFRSEAGSAGRDTRGMIRVHQFSKVELVSIVRPQDAKKEHERMLAAAEEVLKRLELPYRVMLLCTGDMGFTSTKTYDIEVWLPGQNKYREISSCSNCGDFQARRMKARYKELSTGHNIFLHTLNGSALAVGRTMVAILENYQNHDGSISIPKALQPYMGGLTKLGATK